MEMETNYETEFPKKPMGNYSKGKLKMPRAKFDVKQTVHQHQNNGPPTPAKQTVHQHQTNGTPTPTATTNGTPTPKSNGTPTPKYVPKVQKEIPLHLFYPEPARQGLHPCIANDARDGWEVIKGVMDSGASESVTCPSTCPGYEAVPSRMSKAGLNYVSASGDPIPNLGEKRIQVMTENGKESTAKYQVADVSRTLNSVSEICDGGGELGQYVLFNKWGGAILNPATGRQTPFQREDGIYTLEMWVRPKGDSVFPRPGE